jgi:glycogen debranching enzyme
MGIEDIRDALVIRERSTFVLTDPQGNAPAGNTQGFGIYRADTRHLSAYDLTLNGTRPVMLLSTAELGYAMEQVMTNPTLEHVDDRTVLRGTIEMRRQRVVADLVEEHLTLTNFNRFSVSLQLLYRFEADFADIFDVRGYRRERLGHSHMTAVGERFIDYGYTGVDGRHRSTRVEFDRKADYVDETSVLFRITLPPRGSTDLRIEISLDGRGARRKPARPRVDTIAADYARWVEGCTQISTDNEFFNRVLSRSIHDIRMLWSETDDGETYPAAGTPWFDAPFGRDTCIMAMQMLAHRPEIARHCLRLLAKWQGKRFDPARDEEPGKILHELRFDELTQAGDLPYGPYYGSIDSTPLFLMLAAAYWEWTNDVRLIRTLLPAIRAAIEWMDKYGDALGNGYLSYEKHSTKGLINQGWKDSWDAVVHPDGSLARAPIALVEAQGYAYAARVRLAPALERAGDARLAERLRRDARRLQRRFNEEFWSPEDHFFGMALDGDGHLVASTSTNPAHCLWSGIVDPACAPDVVARLMSSDMFSGWGLRTLTETSPRYNPIGYHMGTVWPHDNSIAAMGFKMYGFEDELTEVATALFDASTSFSYFRLPELFGGDARSSHGAPVPYPVACRPQSWAAGAFPLIAQAILGLKAEAPENRVRIVNPRLPYWLNSVIVRGLRVGSGRVSLLYRREGSETRVEVQEATPGLDVVFTNRWPL